MGVSSCGALSGILIWDLRVKGGREVSCVCVGDFNLAVILMWWWFLPLCFWGSCSF
jgi:hypothetical protein